MRRTATDFHVPWYAGSCIGPVLIEATWTLSLLEKISPLEKVSLLEKISPLEKVSLLEKISPLEKVSQLVLALRSKG